MTSPQAGDRLLNIINDKRKANGLSLLSSDSNLNRVAQLKAKDICVNNDVSYYSDKYGSVEELLKSNNISYQTVNCDIIGTNDPSAVSESLINSVNANIKVLNPAINYVGIGVIDNSIYGKIYTIIYVQK